MTAQPWLQRRILVALTTVPGRIMSPHELAREVYADRADGGPEHYVPVLRRTIARLKRAGVPIITHGKRGRSLEVRP